MKPLFKGHLSKKISSLSWTVLLALLTAYIWYTLKVNTLTGFHNLILVIPLFFLLVSAESFFSGKRAFKGKGSIRLKPVLISLAAALILAAFFSFL